jgi:hypothetical protein
MSNSQAGHNGAFAARASRLDGLLPFLRDWLCIATFPLWLPFFLEFFLANEGNRVEVALPAEGLFAYTIAISIACLGDFPVQAWAQSDSAVLRIAARIIPASKLGLIILAVLLVGITVYDNVISASPALSTDKLFLCSLLAAGVGLSLSLFVVLNKD